MWSLPNPASGRACRPGPDLVLHASPEELATDTLITICADAALRLLAMHVTVGDVHDLGLRGVFAVAATVPTSSVILAHRHRAGSSLAEDRKRTMILKSELGLIGIGLLDHLVFVDGAVTSVN